jgi:hypothetical protein
VLPNKPLNQMSESELNAHFAEMDERPMYRKGGAVNFMGTESEFRSRSHPLRYDLPKPAKRRRFSTTQRLMQLDEMAVRAAAQDRELRELGLI